MTTQSQPQIKRFSAHQFTDESTLTFNPTEYSKFKFGCKSTARKFGADLADKFVKSEYFKSVLESANGKRVIILSSPFVHVPTATYAMKDYFIRDLNQMFIAFGLKPVMECKIYRASSYKEEYGEMSKEDRYKVMGNDIFHVDAELIKDNICIFLDDIVITGAHEHRILMMLKSLGLEASPDNYFLYFAELISHETNPIIENFLNYHFVKNLVCLDKIIKNEEFLMNTRVVKYILDSPHDECVTFLKYQKSVFLNTLYNNAIGNSYHLIDDYKINFQCLKQIIKQLDYEQ